MKITLIQHGIVGFIEEQVNETEPSFIVNYENLNWNTLIKQSDKTQDWNKRLAIYGGAEGKYRETNLDNFSLTLEQEYLLKLREGLRKISQVSFHRRKEELGKLVSFYQELAIDIALVGFSVVINSSAPTDIAAAICRASIAARPYLQPMSYPF